MALCDRTIRSKNDMYTLFVRLGYLGYDQIRARNYPAALSGLAGECGLVGIIYREDTDKHDCAIERVALG